MVRPAVSAWGCLAELGVPLSDGWVRWAILRNITGLGSVAVSRLLGCG